MCCTMIFALFEGKDLCLENERLLRGWFRTRQASVGWAIEFGVLEVKRSMLIAVQHLNQGIRLSIGLRWHLELLNAPNQDRNSISRGLVIAATCFQVVEVLEYVPNTFHVIYKPNLLCKILNDM
jgi:hypothetical protein